MANRKKEIEHAQRAIKPAARDAKLEASIEKALVADPSDVEAFVVYSDWLQQQQDFRGELIACQLPTAGAEAVRRANALLEKHAARLLGVFADWEEGPSPLEVEWRCGFIRQARLHVDREQEDDGWDQALLTRALLELPSARFVEELELGCGSVHEDRISERVAEAFVELGPLPTLRKLAFTTDGEEEMLSWTDAGDLGHLSKTTPNLISLFVDAGGLRLGQPDLPRLEALVIETCGFTTANVDSIAAARWPSLEKLVLWFGSRAYDNSISIEDAERLLDPERNPRLRHLGLCNNELTDELVVVLAKHPLLPQLKVLDLSKGIMSDDGAGLMIELADRFRHLEAIDLSANYIGDEIGRRLKSALPAVDLGDFTSAQRELDDDDARYADVGE